MYQRYFKTLEELAKNFDSYSVEQIAKTKISGFLNMIGTNYPEDFHFFIMKNLTTMENLIIVKSKKFEIIIMK